MMQSVFVLQQSGLICGPKEELSLSLLLSLALSLLLSLKVSLMQCVLCCSEVVLSLATKEELLLNLTNCCETSGGDCSIVIVAIIGITPSNILKKYLKRELENEGSARAGGGGERRRRARSE